jgi:SAM-dependent methyltransferase
MMMNMNKKYAERFATAEDVCSYENQEYGRDSYSSLIWDLQKPVLRQWVDAQQKRIGRGAGLLDFACGTGRVLSFLEDLVAESEGVDISPAMAKVATSRCRKASISVGNICSDPQLAAKKYDLITSFRFLLNVEPDIRAAVLRQLRSRLNPQSGILIVNVHGSSRSLRHPAILYRRRRQRKGPAGGNVMLAEMSPCEVKTLLKECGFKIVSWRGFGVLPQFLYRTPLRGIAAWIDRLASRFEWTRYISIDLLYACRLEPQS